ncbi:MAG TPA: TetR/AcrR family transcriptional regulator [Alphaproteobacteria bacterium]
MPPKTKTLPAKPAGPKRRRYGGRPSLEEAKQLHGRILDAAAELFFKRGYGETSIEAIAAQAGIGKLTLYRRFPDKAALFKAVVMRLFDQWWAAVTEVDASQGTPSDVLMATGRRLLSIVLSPTALALHRILFAEASRLPEVCALMYGSRKTEEEERRDPIRNMLHRLVAQGAVRGDDIGFLDQHFIHMIIGRPLRHALLGAPPMTVAAREEHIRKTVELFLHGAATSSRHS